MAANYPPELVEQLEKPRRKTRRDAHALVLSYCQHNGPATVDELLVYIWKVTGKVKSRDYMYHVLLRLRKRGHIERIELESEPVVRHLLTDDGERFVSDANIEYTEVMDD